MSTIFKKIIDREIPAKVVYEDELCLAFHDVEPQAPTHILVIPKKEIASLSAATQEDTALLGHLVNKCAQIAQEAGLKDYRLVTNNGTGAGQSVFHLHFHILGGRPLSWPPG